jgi:hypothetical protein
LLCEHLQGAQRPPGRCLKSDLLRGRRAHPRRDQGATPVPLLDDNMALAQMVTGANDLDPFAGPRVEGILNAGFRQLIVSST